MAILRVNRAAGQAPPSLHDMTEVASAVGLKEFDPDIVADMCALQQGGNLRSLDDIEDSVHEAAAALGRGKSTKDDVQAELAFHGRMRTFLSQLELRKFPGGSALQRAMSALKLFSMMQNKTAVESQSDAQAQQQARSLNEAMGLANNITADERKLLGEEFSSSEPPRSADVESKPARREWSEAHDSRGKPRPKQKPGSKSYADQQPKEKKQQGEAPVKEKSFAQRLLEKFRLKRKGTAGGAKGSGRDQGDGREKPGPGQIDESMRPQAGERRADGQSGSQAGEKRADGQSGSQAGEKRADGQSGSQAGERRADGQSGSQAGERRADGQSGSQAGERRADGQSGLQAGEKRADGQSGSQAGERRADGQSGSQAGERRADGQSGSQAGERRADGQSGSQAGERLADGQSGSQAGEKRADGQSGSQAGERRADGQSGSQAGEKRADGQSGSQAGERRADGQSGSQAGERRADGQSGSQAGEKRADGQSGSQAGERRADGQSGSQAGEKRADGQSGSQAGERRADGQSGSQAGERRADGQSGSQAGEKRADGQSGSQAGERRADGQSGSQAGEKRADGQSGSQAGERRADGQSGSQAGENQTVSQSGAKPQRSDSQGDSQPSEKNSDGSVSRSGVSDEADEELGQSRELNESGSASRPVRQLDGEVPAQEHSTPFDGDQLGGTPPPNACQTENVWLRQQARLNRQQLELANRLSSGSELRYVLDSCRMLDRNEQVQVYADDRAVPDGNGEERRRRPIKEYSEIAKMSAQDLAVLSRSPTLFYYKAATGKFLVPERVTRVHRKQIIFMLVDGSGSMKGVPHLKALGFVFNRLKSVASGEAELWLATFDQSLKNVHHAATESEAKALMTYYRKNSFTGGGTNIGASVLAAHNYIQKVIVARNMFRPEIWVLTDDDTSISNIAPEQVAGTRVHGMAVGAHNRTLELFCKATGGTFWDRV